MLGPAAAAAAATHIHVTTDAYPFAASPLETVGLPPATAGALWIEAPSAEMHQQASQRHLSRSTRIYKSKIYTTGERRLEFGSLVHTCMPPGGPAGSQAWV